MTFWFITVAMAALVVLILSRSLLRPNESAVADATEFDLKVYRDQLSEVDRDVARGVVSEIDADRARTEISRRILQADANRRGGDSAATKASWKLPAALAIIVSGSAFALYSSLGAPGYGDLALEDRIAFADALRENRPDQQTAVESLPPFVPPETGSAQFAQLMTQLRQAVAARPDDLQGHILLAQNEARMGNFVAAAAAQQGVLRIKEDAASAKDISDYGELMVLAAGGYVSPEAETAFRAALGLDEGDGRGRYYLGLMMVQTGRPDIGFRLWDALLRNGPPDAPWIQPILSQIEPIARAAGVNYSIPAIGPGDAPGPSVEDIEAASELSAEDRMAMVGSMVEGLSNRLASEGGPPRDWARLITSLAVLGDPDQALVVFENAMQVFAGDPGAIDIITAAGSQAGVAE
ncbi:MAG: c-type cytochrome biogenesis protein CcmI [Sulfitobacter sp.]